MQLLKKILPLGVLLLSGCTTVIDEQLACSPDPVYIYFTAHSGINVDVDITTTRSGEGEPLPIGMMGIGHTADATPDLNRFRTEEDLKKALQEGLMNDKYEMVPSGESSYAINPSEGVQTPAFPYIDNSAVSIYAYAPYNDTITPQWHEGDGYWYIPLNIKTNGAQTDYLYANTTCSQKDYQGNIDLNLRHALIRLDVIVEHEEIIIGGSTEDNTEEDDEIIIGGSTEDNTEEDDEIIIGGSTEDNTEEDDETIIGGNTEDSTEEEAPESTVTVSYNTDPEAKANSSYDILAPSLRTTRSGDDETLSIKLYTDNNGEARMSLHDGKVFKNSSFDYDIHENRTVEHVVSKNKNAEADTVTFYLLPATKILKITLDGSKHYIPQDTDGNKVVHQLSEEAGTRQVININY